MNRWIRTAAAAVLVTAGSGTAKDPVARGAAPDCGQACGHAGCGSAGCKLAGAGCAGGGCNGDTCLGNLYDACWPQRYSYTARQEVLAPFAIQVRNAEIIEQTMWNRHFVPNTDVLNAAGLERLNYLSRRRPSPDARLFLQTARDPELAYDPTDPDKLVNDRLKLNQKRADAIRRYMAAETAARPVNFEVTVIDPVDPAVRSIGPTNAVRGIMTNYTSSLSGAASGQANYGGFGGTTVIAAPSTGGAPR